MSEKGLEKKKFSGIEKPHSDKENSKLL